MGKLKIAKIRFRSGMIDNVEEKSSCKEHILTGEEIPLEVKQLFNSDKAADLGGKWGDPSWGSPIQYHWAKVEMESGKSYEFEVCNLAIMVFHSEDEKTKRLFKFLARVERYIKRHE